MAAIVAAALAFRPPLSSARYLNLRRRTTQPIQSLHHVCSLARRPTCALQDPSAAPSETENSPSPEKEEDEPFTVLTSMRSLYNDIVVVDTPTLRLLLLDSSHNVHSMLNKDQIWTGSYWDDFACLPAIVPHGPIAILGLGAGTAAHLLLELWPSLHVVGWEIDEILVDVAREYFGLSNLEKYNVSGGLLSVHIGDALSPGAAIEGGFAGILVDLFSDGKIIPQLHKAETWLKLAKKLKPNGRIMVNCGGARAEASQCVDKKVPVDGSSWIQNSTVKALCCTFPGKLNWKKIADKESENYLALTGPLPDLETWSSSVPSQLSSNVQQWKPCEPA